MSDTTADAVSQALTQLANAHRRVANEAINATARTGTPAGLRRVMSEIGFLQERQFQTFLANRRNVTFSATSGPREIKQIVLVPFGWRLDANRLSSPTTADRTLRSAEDAGTGGVKPYPDDPNFYMPGYLDATGFTALKYSQVLRAANSTSGPAPHFVVNRRGDVFVGPTIDAKTSVIPEYSDNGIFIALETALVIRKEDHERQQFVPLVELPLEAAQLVSTAVIIKKLLEALGVDFPKVFQENLISQSDPRGFTYARRPADSAVISGNFLESDFFLPWDDGNFDYAPSQTSNFFTLVGAQGSYDLATEVWRTTPVQPATAARANLQAVIATVDTAGAESIHLGAYVDLAARSRSNDLQTQARKRLFARRRQVAHRDSDDATGHGSGAASSLDSSASRLSPATGYEPHAYNFTTGKWLDDGTY